MKQTFRAVALTLVLASGCARNTSSDTWHITPAAPRPTSTASADSARLIPTNTGDAEVTKLITTFAGRDGMGERLKSSPWFDSVAVEGKPLRRDSLQLISNFGVGGLTLDGDTAHVIINYRIVGAIDRVRDSTATMRTRYTSTPGNQSAEFVLAKTQAGWRIARAPRTMRVFASAYLNDPTLPALPADARETISRGLGAGQ